MSTSTSLERPALNEIYEAEQVRDRPPVSALAYLAFVAGLVSLLTPLSLALLPISFVAIALGGLVYWQVARNPHLAGTKWALTGLGLGLASAVWALTASISTNNYLYEQAGRNAKVYLDLLGEGKMYEALELHVPKGDRQIAGTDLAAYYGSKSGESGELIQEVINSPATQEVIRMGAKANWRFSKGVEVRPVYSNATHYVGVEMANEIDSRIARVAMARRFFVSPDGQRTAWWSIERIDLSDD